MPRKYKAKNFTDFEESLNGGSREEVIEVPLSSQPLFYTGLLIFLFAALAVGRVLFLGVVSGEIYKARAEANSSELERLQAPRGLVFARGGEVLAENQPVFLAVLKTSEFLKDESIQEKTLASIKEIMGIDRELVWSLIKERDQERIGDPIVLSADLSQTELIQLKSLNSLSLVVESGFKRNYPDGPIFSSIIGYTGLPTALDLRENAELTGVDFVGKSGLEAFYDKDLRGKNGFLAYLRDAKGEIFEEKKERPVEAGAALNLTIDAEFQRYFYHRMQEGLTSLGRNSGVGLALNPRNGEVLALINLPSYDPNIFLAPEKNEERLKLLNSPETPLFNRAISGTYSPGSTIKPLVALAALSEGVINTEKQIYSPGYLEIPNPYDPQKPTLFLDWRPQGWVNLERAIAQSSNVYFYTVGGGFGDIKGLGIKRLNDWWQKFNLGKLTGIDLPWEAKGLLPTVEEKEKRTGTPWLLGDTYNVSIGQGDLLLTPLQILNYVAAIGNGGKIYRPFLVSNFKHSEVASDLSNLQTQISEVEKGMKAAVNFPLGTAYLLHDLQVSVAAKTGTAQILSNTQANAFFVGFMPAEDPEIVILILVERSREGSLNTVPIAKDVLNWYYLNRIPHPSEILSTSSK
ncbi:MAG: penicillin-binding protein 2 [Candidatus Liptonbacteria bacterium]|nr:penicillin-binding protein 2 [Candidatus Liptonbacteria bacterium]